MNYCQQDEHEQEIKMPSNKPSILDQAVTKQMRQIDTSRQASKGSRDKDLIKYFVQKGTGQGVLLMSREKLTELKWISSNTTLEQRNKLPVSVLSTEIEGQTVIKIRRCSPSESNMFVRPFSSSKHIMSLGSVKLNFKGLDSMPRTKCEYKEHKGTLLIVLPV